MLFSRFCTVECHSTIQIRSYQIPISTASRQFCLWFPCFAHGHLFVEKGLRGVHADKSAASICKLRQWRSQPKHIKNATWPEGCGQRNEKTRKRENQKTETTEKTRKREIENQKTGTLLAVFGFSSFSPFSRFRVFAVFAFSPFSRFSCFRRFRVFAVFAFSPFSRPQVDSSRFRVFGFSRFRVHRCFHMFSPGVFVLQNGLLRYIPYACPKL